MPTRAWLALALPRIGVQPKRRVLGVIAGDEIGAGPTPRESSRRYSWSPLQHRLQRRRRRARKLSCAIAGNRTDSIADQHHHRRRLRAAFPVRKGAERRALHLFIRARNVMDQRGRRLARKSARDRRRIAWPRIGAAPPVEMPITTGERLTMAPNWKSQ